MNFFFLNPLNKSPDYTLIEEHEMAPVEDTLSASLKINISL
jgi:hypothetical protein